MAYFSEASLGEMFHGTSTKLWPGDSLKVGGVVRSMPPERVYQFGYQPVFLNAVYITSSKSRAKEYAEEAVKVHGGSPVVLTVRGVDVQKLRIDEDFIFGGRKHYETRNWFTPEEHEMLSYMDPRELQPEHVKQVQEIINRLGSKAAKEVLMGNVGSYTYKYTAVHLGPLRIAKIDKVG